MAEEEQKKTFQQQVVEKLRSGASLALNEHPELRSVAVVFDWHEDLNTAAMVGLWQDRNGDVNTKASNCDVIIGGLEQTCKMLSVQLQAGARMVNIMRTLVDRSAAELQKLEEEKQRVRSENQTEPETSDEEEAAEKATEPDDVDGAA